MTWSKKSPHCYNVLCSACVTLCLHCVCQSPLGALVWGENQGQSRVGFAFSTPRSSELTQQLFVVTFLVQLGCFVGQYIIKLCCDDKSLTNIYFQINWFKNIEGRLIKLPLQRWLSE